MTVSQVNKIKMYGNVLTFLEDNQKPLGKANPDITDSLKDFIRLSVALPALVEKTKIDVSVFTRKKKQIRIKLTEKIQFLVSMMRCSALIRKDKKTARQNELTLSDFNKAPEGIFHVQCDSALKRYIPLKKELKKLNITPKYVSGIKTLFKAYQDIVGAPRDMLGEKRLANMYLTGHIAEMEKILKSIDKMMLKIKKEIPELYKGYRGWRVMKGKWG